MNNFLSTLSSQELEILKQGAQQLRAHQSELAEQLNSILNSLMFHNNHTLHPGRLRDIATGETENFLQFLSNYELPAINKRGKKLAEDGLGYQSLLSIGAYFGQVCFEKLGVKDPELLRIVLKAANIYLGSAFDGYLQQYKAQIIKDQMQTRQALKNVQQERLK